MTGARRKTGMRPAAWIAWGVVGAGFLYLAAMSYALELGAVQHDAFCPEHGWAVERT